MSEYIHVVCSRCDSINRLPYKKLDAGGKCGKCQNPLFAGQPVELSGNTFQRYIQKNQLPIVVDYWAPWCGPCKMMAPAFAGAASQMEPYVLFAKVNTESEQLLASTANIRSIPTLVIYRDGLEVSRMSGAMDQPGLVSWIQQNL